MLIVSILVILLFWGIIALEQGSEIFKGLNLFILIFIILMGFIALREVIKREKETKAGYPEEDELTNQIKYKTGYYAYISSMYMWLFIYFMKDKFPDIETMLGGGILVSALIFFISKNIVKRELNG